MDLTQKEWVWGLPKLQDRFEAFSRYRKNRQDMADEEELTVERGLRSNSLECLSIKKRAPYPYEGLYTKGRGGGDQNKGEMRTKKRGRKTCETTEHPRKF